MLIHNDNHVLKMSNQEFGCYGNNNYLPSLQPPTFIPSSPSVQIHNMPSSMYQNGSVGQGIMSTNFTFTTPTQGTAITYALPVYTAPVSGTQSFPQGVHAAPGAGVQWQHSIPQQMPWNVTMPQTNSSVTVFTAQSLHSSVSQQPTVSLRQTTGFEPQASCSFTRRRPKRHMISAEDATSPTVKLRITDEKMAARMQGLHITGPSKASDVNNGLNESTSWQQLRDIEARLEDEDIEVVLSDNKADPDLPRVHITAGINAQDLLKPNSILPKKILSDLNKPCMEVVLWKPPGIVKSVEQMSKTNDEIDNSSESDIISKNTDCPSPRLQYPRNCLDLSVPLLPLGDSYVIEKSTPSVSESMSWELEDTDMDL